MAKKPVVIDEFHIHEVLDRAYLIQNLIEDSLAKHRVVMQNPHLAVLVKTIQDHLTDLYMSVRRSEHLNAITEEAQKYGLYDNIDPVQ